MKFGIRINANGLGIFSLWVRRYIDANMSIIDTNSIGINDVVIFDGMYSVKQVFALVYGHFLFMLAKKRSPKRRHPSAIEIIFL